jgi:D-alanyl-D-alanine carboxypeptidase/D-alanyl-D-alanine-endopeptidase (penicillin-binding protein 4)
MGSRGYGVRLSVHQPALWSARLLLRALKAHGVSVDGTAKVRDSRIPEAERFKPDGSRELAFVTSMPLSQIIKLTNKESINLYAELILRTLGRERGALLPSAGSGRERGDDEAGTALVRLWLSRAGIANDRIAIHDGCGLSRLDLVTPKSTAALLFAIYRTPAAELFKESLPVAGVDGTLRGRLGAIAGRVVAKTGTLTYDHSLSGYVTSANGETFAFSIMCNDSIGKTGGSRLIDQLVSALADYPQNPKHSPIGREKHS